MNNEKEDSMYHYISDEYDNPSLLKTAINIYKKEGLTATVRKILIYVMYKTDYSIFNRDFNVNGEIYQYFINRYMAVRSERVVEIPFAMDFLKKNDYEKKRVLEIGNVLSYYFDLHYKIVDKYERGTHIDTVDIIDFNPDEKYDIIISISTIEHIGYDEPVREVGKSKKAFLKIIDLLDNKGIALITVPLVYNPEIDSIITNNEIEFSKRYFLKRISHLNLWKETNMEEAMSYKYGSKYPNANAVAFLIYLKNS